MDNIILPIFDDSENEPQNDLKNKTVNYILQMINLRDQLRINHWQTSIYSHHKLADELIDEITEFIDNIAEYTFGLFGKPTINTFEMSLFDTKLKNIQNVLNLVEDANKEMIAEYNLTEHEGMKAYLSDFDKVIQKYKYLFDFE